MSQNLPPIKKSFVSSDASVAIITHQGKYLLQCRDSIDGIFYPGYWSLFGGAAEKDESPSQTVHREVREELNTLINPVYFSELKFNKNFWSENLELVTRTYFACDLSSSDVKNLVLNEGYDYAFVEYSQMDRLLICPYDRFMIDYHAACR